MFQILVGKERQNRPELKKYLQKVKTMMKYDVTRKVAIIGAGLVGMSYAYALLNQGACDEMVLIDIDKRRAEGEAMDLNHGIAFSPKDMKIYAGNYNDCRDAEIIVITAGVAQKEGESRLDLLNRNASIIRSIVKEVMKSGFDGVFLVGTNPVDVLTYVVYKESGLPSKRVIGTGTSLDSARLRYLLSDYLKIDSRNIHAHIIGEHGDSEFPLWKNATIGIKPLTDVIEEHDEYSYSDLDKIYSDVRNAAYKIIERKRSTYYGIGMVLCHITKAIFNDTNSILPLSVYIDKLYGVRDLYIGMPAVINREGIREIVKINMIDADQEKFIQSAGILKESLNKLNL